MSEPHDQQRRVAVISDAAGYVGPSLARLLAATHDLVVGDPEAGLVADLESAGAAVAVAEDVRDLSKAEATARLVALATERFGRLDAAVAFTGRIVVGRFLRSDVADLRETLVGCIEAPYLFLRAVVPAMLDGGGGQVLLFTSAAGARPTPGAPLYSSARAGANMLVRNVAAEVVDRNVQINAIGTNFMDFPAFLAGQPGGGRRGSRPGRGDGADGSPGDDGRARPHGLAVRRRDEPLHHGSVRRLRRRLGSVPPPAARQRATGSVTNAAVIGSARRSRRRGELGQRRDTNERIAGTTGVTPSAAPGGRRSAPSPPGSW